MDILIVLQRLVVFAFLAAGLLSGGSAPAQNNGTSPPATLAPGDYQALTAAIGRHGSAAVIVRLRQPAPLPALGRPGGGTAAAALLLRQAALNRLQDALLARLDPRNLTAVKRFRYSPGIALAVDQAALEQLRKLPEVLAIQPDHLNYPTLAQSAPLVGAVEAWRLGFAGNGQAVAILDTGVDRNHTFLAGKVVSEACYSTTHPGLRSTSLCPNGLNAQTGPGAGAPCTLSGCNHGTHVAGIAAGRGDSFSGIARDASLIAVQVFSRLDNPDVCGTPPCLVAFDSDIIRGLERVLELGAGLPVAAANMSLGGRTYTSEAQCDADNGVFKMTVDELRAAGIATVAASGNARQYNAISTPGCISFFFIVWSTTEIYT
ncbi:MAG: S8 family serine peptidase, partial [Pseudomonadota bacterium]|nr:S8 family serine peptidase [Pseudomonadota bacterium]